MEDIKCDREKIQKIKNIIEREIEKELISKQNEVTDISEKIKHILRNLELLKYIVAVNYYDQNTTLTPKKVQEDENEEEKTQTQIHPCIKKLMPFRSHYEKSFGEVFSSRSYETRSAKKNNSVDVKKEVNGNSSQEKIDEKSGEASNVKMPQYIPPKPNADENVETVNSMRGSMSKEYYRIIVGNVSKWIPPETREDNSTHKWMVYIRSKDSGKDVTKLLRKVRYFLHESYKPHDIIDVTSPPFHLTRRGWGEFPVRVQLHFVHPLNKPVDIIHNLKLDMTCSGIQMLGAETVVEVFLHQANSIASARNFSKSDTKSQSATEEILKEKQDIFEESLLTGINGVKPNFADVKQENETDIIIKQEPEEPEALENEKPVNSKMEEVYLAINISRKYMGGGRETTKLIEIEHNYLKTEENDLHKPLNKFTDSILLKNSEKTCKNGAVLDSTQVINKKNQERLNKIEIRGNRREEEIFRNLKSIATKLETETQSKYSLKVFRNMYLVNVVQRAHATKLKNVEPLVKWFVQRWPIVSKLSLDPTYKTIHPYSSPSEEEFFKYNIGKQRSAEWFRAKAIQKVLKSLKSVIPIEEEIWSTKQILLWSRFHGYSPSSFQKNPKNDSVELNEIRNKRLKLIESSSDSEEGSWCNSSKKFKIADDKFPNGLNVTERKRNFKKSRRKDPAEETVDRYRNYKDVSTWSEADDGLRFGTNELRALVSSDLDSDIDVVEVDEKVKESPSKKKEVKLSITTTQPHESGLNRFVCETARQIGVKVVEEETIPGVKSDSVLRVMSQGVSSFLEELIRRSFAQAWLRNENRCPDSLEANDVLTTLIEHQRFDIFTNRGLGMPNPGKS